MRCVNSTKAIPLSLLYRDANNREKIYELRHLKQFEEKVINEITEPLRALENVADVVRMFRSAIVAWHECHNAVLSGTVKEADFFPELNLKTINVLSAFFVLDNYTQSTLVVLAKKGVIAKEELNLWRKAPDRIQKIMNLARDVRGALHHSLPIKSYHRHSSKNSSTLAVELVAHSGRSKSEKCICASEFMASLKDLTSYAHEMWLGLLPRVLASYDDLCQSLHSEVIKAGGSDMLIGQVNISGLHAEFHFLGINCSPIDRLKVRLYN